MLNRSQRSAELRDAKEGVMRIPLLVNCSQKVLAVADLPVPGKPASQNIDMLWRGSSTQVIISARIFSRVPARLPGGDTRVVTCGRYRFELLEGFCAAHWYPAKLERIEHTSLGGREKRSKCVLRVTDLRKDLGHHQIDRRHFFGEIRTRNLS
jgi:hypothetical protein